ncbi:MAG: Na+/H+ antiporter subunit E [Candidatus Margulisbacteria bacterium]|nr:Na+/H+ antiporter subunit E [Candidatus Margulisiibacteriota bacterium]
MNILKRVYYFFVFALFFLGTFIKANLTMAWAVLCQPLSTLKPGFITLDIKKLTIFEALILAHCITLTPGTTSIDMSEDCNDLTIHAFDARNPGALKKEIRTGIQASILRVTR